MTQCSFENCKQENTLVWLGKPLCGKHWIWVCDHKEKAYKVFKIKQEEPIVSEVKVVDEKAVVKELEKETAAEAATTATVVEATTEAKAKSDIKRERYNDELDKRILELDGLKKSITEISKDIGRSYASTMYRLRKLRGGDKTEEKAVEAPAEAPKE